MPVPEPKMITPSGPQSPPLAESRVPALGTSVKTRIAPVSTSVVFNFPSAVYATCLLSGDQNAYALPWVPANSRASPESVARSHVVVSVVLPVALVTNVSQRPSGDTETPGAAWP